MLEGCEHQAGKCGYYILQVRMNFFIHSIVTKVLEA